jgi:sialate O-acetylesterase
MRQIKFILFFIIVYAAAIGQTKLPAFFGDDMVLQQNEKVNIWGTDKPNTTVLVKGSWGQNAKVTANEKGNWKLKLPTPGAGGPYTLVIKGSSEILFKNILIGELWFCSGQSNMEMPVKGNLNQPVVGSQEAILNSANNNIRFFKNAHATSLTPLTDAKGKWQIAGPSTTGECSATAYFFARKINSVLNIPVGIITSSWGSSTVESWMDTQILSAFKNTILPDTIPKNLPQTIPTIMYNAMLHPFIGYTIKGVLWYQGEANRVNANEYRNKFTALINSWRRQWQQGDFPFYFVQIAPFEPGKINAAYLREAQLQTMLTVQNTGMAVTLDIGEQTVIHPSQKEPVGVRLAYWALVNNYGVKGITCSGPVYKQMEKTADNKIVLTFDNCNDGLTSFGKPLSDFEIAGEDKVFYPAEAKINNDKKGKVIVWSESVKDPVSVRYAFKNWAEASLFNTQGLPASSFRTDDW